MAEAVTPDHHASEFVADVRVLYLASQMYMSSKKS